MSEFEKHPRLEHFRHQGESIEVEFVETMQVKDGVSCDVYRFRDRDTSDLAIVSVDAGAATPMQRVLQGDETVEGFLSGKGALCTPR